MSPDREDLVLLVQAVRDTLMTLPLPKRLAAEAFLQKVEQLVDRTLDRLDQVETRLAQLEGRK